MIVEQAVAVPMADGTVLRADLWRPADDRPVPAIVMRTPYLRHSHAFTAFLDPLDAGTRGYAVVIQDVRGRGDSEGSFEPFVAEARDGAETIAWVAAQPWCDGRVVMTGMSYVGATQWLAATEAGEALRGIAPIVSSADYGEGWSLRNGVREHGFLSTWTAVSLGTYGRLWNDEPARAYDDRDGLVEIAPWSAPWWDDATPASYWEERSAAPRRERVRVPALQVGGWYDAFVEGTLRTFAAGSHPHDRLVVGPWGHQHTLPRIVGEHDLGWAGDGENSRLPRTVLRWFDAILEGREPRLPRATIYVLGARRWVSLDAWPPPGARTVAATVEGEATLRYDPADPTPFRGGHGLLMEVPDHGFGPRDQRPLLARDDVAALPLGAAAAGPLTLAGPVAARLQVSADGDGPRDWVATLCVEAADGELWNLTEGIARVSPDAAEVEVPMGQTCVELGAGERLVLLVAAAATPRFSAPATPATQRVLGGGVELTVAEI